jgi:hypothetical protein
MNRWLTPLANVAILAGIALVAYELNQNASLARMALVNEGNLVQNQLWADLMGEVPGEVIARAIECPEEMSFADYVAMDAFLFSSMNMLYRDYQLAEEGIFTEEEWKRLVDTYAAWYLGNAFGRAWWDEEARNFFPSEFVSHVENQFESMQGRDSYSYWLKLRSRLLGPDLPSARKSACRSGAPQ